MKRRPRCASIKATATVISQTALDSSETVYNFEVQDFSTYHIGEIGIWVHNADCCKVLSPEMMRLRTELTFKEAGILSDNGKLTQKAIQRSQVIDLTDGVIRNPTVVKELTKDGSNITDWNKYTTESVDMRNGQSSQIHFYMHKNGKVDYNTNDYKVKGIIKP